MYIPARGDFVHLNLNPRTGREQCGERFGLIISPQKFNQISSLAFTCPITTKSKGFPLEVKIRDNPGRVYGVVLVHHLKSIDWKARKVQYIEDAPPEVVEEVIAKLEPLIF